jgi:hypothetical protein
MRGCGFEKLLEGSATDISPGSVTVTHRTGDPLLECQSVPWPICTAAGHLAAM